MRRAALVAALLCGRAFACEGTASELPCVMKGGSETVDECDDCWTAPAETILRCPPMGWLQCEAEQILGWDSAGCEKCIDNPRLLPGHCPVCGAEGAHVDLVVLVPDGWGRFDTMDAFRCPNDGLLFTEPTP